LGGRSAERDRSQRREPVIISPKDAKDSWRKAKHETRNPKLETNSNDQKHNVPNNPDSDSSFWIFPV
ncbi:MAG: hypothetical protein ACXWYD_20785, partial [Candidatus Binatia bacterium]